jgi:phage terminase small subunit
LKGEKMPFDPKQLKFIEECVHGQTPALAATIAGYNAKYGSMLYAMPEVRAEIDRRLEIVNREQAKLDKLQAIAKGKTKPQRDPHSR